MDKQPKPGKKAIKYAWAATLSLAVAGLALSENSSPWLPLMNGLIDFLQHQKGYGPALPGAGQIPTGSGALNFPPRKKVQPAATNGPAVASPDMAPAH